MKKLMIGLVAASATIFAFGALPSGTSFEDYVTVGEKTIAQLTDFEDDGVGTNDRYWFYEGDTTAAIGVITNDTPNAPSRPAQFAGNQNLQYLDLTASDATNVLYRAVNSVAGKSAVAYLDGQSIDNGLYLDTLVKFTPGELTSLELGDGDKIALTYVEETDDEDNDGKVLSNIVVRAGYVNGSTVTPTNYIMDAIPGFSAADWHRLTVRAINVGYADAPVGFVVYVDGVEVTYDLAQEPGDSAYLAALAGNSIVANYLYNTEKHAFIPSAVNTGTAKTTLSAVGFKGNGCVDDISFTATPPTFIQEGTTVTIAWDDNVTSYTVATNGTTMVDGEAVSGEGSANLLIADGTTTITVTATYGDGYTNGVWTASVGTLSNGVWTDFESGATLTINSMFPLFQVGETQYGTFGAALTAAVKAGTSESPATIKLLADFAGTDSQAALTFNTGYIVLDLNGKTIRGLDSDYSIANMGASLTIIDSASGGTVAVPQMSDPEQFALGSLLVYGDTAITVIRAGIYQGVVTVATSEVLPTDVLTVYGGQFYDPDYDEDAPESVFYLVKYNEEYNFLPEGVTYKYDGSNYFTVSESTPEPPAPTVVQIPTAALNLVYTGNQQTGVAAGEGYTLSGTYVATDAGNYIATATLDQDCVWSDETTAPKEINWSIAADTSATVDVALTSYIAEYSAQLEFPTATATIGGGAVEGTTNWVESVISEPEAGATNTYTVTFTVTTANYAGSSGTATFKVYKEASSGGWEPDPSKIDPSATAADTYPELDGTALATANAQKLTAWAEAKSIDFADVKDSAATYVDAYLLNCAPDGVEAAKEAFKVTITVNSGGSVTVTAPTGYNVEPTIQGKASLSASEWHAKTDGDKFFRAVLSL